jgi:hypothetical protein
VGIEDEKLIAGVQLRDIHLVGLFTNTARPFVCNATMMRHMNAADVIQPTL